MSIMKASVMLESLPRKDIVSNLEPDKSILDSVRQRLEVILVIGRYDPICKTLRSLPKLKFEFYIVIGNAFEAVLPLKSLYAAELEDI